MLLRGETLEAVRDEIADDLMAVYGDMQAEAPANRGRFHSVVQIKERIQEELSRTFISLTD